MSSSRRLRTGSSSWSTTARPTTPPPSPWSSPAATIAFERCPSATREWWRHATGESPRPARRVSSSRSSTTTTAGTPIFLDALSTVLSVHPRASAAYGLPRMTDESGIPMSSDIRRAFGYRRQRVQNGRVVPLAPGLPTTFEVLAVWDAIATAGQVLIRRCAYDERLRMGRAVGHALRHARPPRLDPRRGLRRGYGLPEAGRERHRGRRRRQRPSGDRQGVRPPRRCAPARRRT